MALLFPYKSVLIVCSVNTARSRLAEGFLKDFFSKNKIDSKVHSCGISSHARDGMLISRDAIDVMKEIGINLSEESLSMDLKKHPELLEGVDLILTLTEKHKREVMEFNGVDNIKIYTLKEFAGESGDIDDPSMKGIDGFRIARDEITDCLMKGLNRVNNKKS
jgi:protein-tyrosine-phosphatase